MNKYIKIFFKKEIFRYSNEWALLALRVIPSFYMFFLHGKRKIIGGIANFIGVVRDSQKEEEELVSLELEHYPGMTEKAIMTICRDAQKRWAINFVKVIHRVGNLKTGDNIVLVITASAHRKESFKSAEFIMDFLKTDAPFWKSEETQDGSFWISEREKDKKASESWLLKNT